MKLDKFLGLPTTPKKKKKKHSRYISKKLKEQVREKYNNQCAECGSKKDLEFDHIEAFSKGGITTLDNLQLLCRKCNRKKHDKFTLCTNCGEKYIYKQYIYCYECYRNSLCE